MANGIRLAREKGFTFGDLVVDNTNGVFLKRVSKPSTPTLSRFDIIAPGRDGSKSYKNRYLDQEIVVVIGIYKEDITERRQTQRSIIQKLLIGEDRLSFNDEPNLFHKAEVFDAIERDDEDEFFTDLEIKFKCSPFMYEKYDDFRDIKVNRATQIVNAVNGILIKSQWDGITARTIKTISNNGNFETKPVIEITGTASRISFELNNAAFVIVNLNGSIFVDTENMNVYSYGPTSEKVSKLPQFSGRFLTIPVGDSSVVIDGTGLNVSVLVEYRNTYIC